jgi:hypothetical protein
LKFYVEHLLRSAIHNGGVMKSFKIFKNIIFLAIIILLTSCSSSVSKSPENVVESYLNALVGKDSATLSTLSCADWEASALMELDSLQAVDVKLSDLSCSLVSADDTNSVVNCTGYLIATYNGEDQKIDLSTRNYLVQEFDNTPLVCGYK